MLSFSGVTFVLFCFVFVFFAFTEAAALRSNVLRSSICMRLDSHTQIPNLTTVCALFRFCFLDMSLFPSIFVSITFFSLYGEYVVRFPLLDNV